ncbi:class I SAM-dependent methyltransferase [Aquimarina brevivitae]|uniref:2-polyprenyl-3-methyl-5-hydroxy-6-metoxy-1, 4-benzoquinol methylase n=1 Tax=Aquimarina brevivitae TaxID=323412 RepID=A0A4Q7PFR7_9FLAO|nr:class I SAM-dependent methyltransferase [Aquimarina brevivitae]RZS99326.1 2-polyprenyl-3-methyl-5-hydroxy-6-metoxy-1,4-benzoquinol methylase [Aquimarina brevivitae]
MINNPKGKIFLECKDFLVSGEKFQLVKDHTYDMLFTTPQPKPEELDRYYESDAYISHTDANEGFLNRLYQSVKKINLKNKIKLIDKTHPQKGTLLDVGAGTGDFLVTAKNDGWNIQGTEPNAKARQLAATKNISLQSDLASFTSNSFDVITLWHVLEHVSALQEYIERLNDLLKPNGTLIIAVPNFKSYDAKYYKEYWAAYDVPRHLWHFSKTAIRDIFKEKGFELIKVKPLWFDAFYISLMSEKLKKGKINYFLSFIIGFYSNLKGLFSKQYSSHIYVLRKP